MRESLLVLLSIETLGLVLFLFQLSGRSLLQDLGMSQNITKSIDPSAPLDIERSWLVLHCFHFAVFWKELQARPSFFISFMDQGYKMMFGYYVN